MKPIDTIYRTTMSTPRQRLDSRRREVEHKKKETVTVCGNVNNLVNERVSAFADDFQLDYWTVNRH